MITLERVFKKFHLQKRVTKNISFSPKLFLNFSKNQCFILHLRICLPPQDFQFKYFLDILYKNIFLLGLFSHFSTKFNSLCFEFLLFFSGNFFLLFFSIASVFRLFVYVFLKRMTPPCLPEPKLSVKKIDFYKFTS